MKNLPIVILCAGVLFGLGVLVGKSPWRAGDGASPAVETAAKPDTEPPNEPLTSLGYGGGFPHSWAELRFRQEFTIIDFSSVIVIDMERDRGSSQWRIAAVYRGGTSMRILRAAAAGRDVLCFGGFAMDGDLVIELWKLQPFVRRGTGEPIPPGKYFDISEVYRGDLGSGGLYGIEIDPDLRFAMALLSSGTEKELYKFPISTSWPPPPPERIASSETLPELADMKWLSKADHSVLGRVWSLRDRPSYRLRILFTDPDNDGQIDGPPMMGDYESLEARGLEGFEKWDSLLGP